MPKSREVRNIHFGTITKCVYKFNYGFVKPDGGGGDFFFRIPEHCVCEGGVNGVLFVPKFPELPPQVGTRVAFGISSIEKTRIDVWTTEEMYKAVKAKMDKESKEAVSFGKAVFA